MSKLRPPVGRSARARVEDTVSRWLDWTEENGKIYLGTVAPGEPLRMSDDPEVRAIPIQPCPRPSSLVRAS
jgi:hypothetical protein